ncbi:hypothetical protein B0T18DRAFT_391176 [Schizothecium vesticola]|uniref:Chitin-binding type-1 domain-containing protein n=1 Tax=Schizothecium vesticola TaxID=314040 RepID=A0AA40EWD1_9PEZI|nr:hypothetical protein B0T18DRAFT_391176 [Schizothecium vesticola]
MSLLSALLLRIAALALLSTVVFGDDCQPWKWKRQENEIICRYDAITPSTVNYYTCMELAVRYDIAVELFFTLNPSVAPDCSNIRENTIYCVRGYKQPLLAIDGKCGPQNRNASCAGTAGQCCNSRTWKCGSSQEDCEAGTCFNGACNGGGADVYAVDGKCGPRNGNRQCGGRWGECCSFNGVCGSGVEFCGKGNCESGNCTAPLKQPAATTGSYNLLWEIGTTPDGTCGGPKTYTCGVLWGSCCNSQNKCGSGTACERGCQTKFGKCLDVTLSFGNDYVGKINTLS